MSPPIRHILPLHFVVDLLLVRGPVAFAAWVVVRLPVWFRKMGENKIIALRCAIPSILTFFQQWTGTNAINYYAPQIFASLGISSTTSSLRGAASVEELKKRAEGGVVVVGVRSRSSVSDEEVAREKRSIVDSPMAI